ncbi:hypothetical protein LAZ67_15000210 [Cordylochernes scorpioides]|uniref:Uncharacterized protein n=1 Tax=Cordylochernes scorpioides TaxID=51811 RepID=A0ABY6LBZ0_9ARAC|nr:hypothetical protein LAZ67_15000210 [Cordylochernes scorpioides]
MSWAMKLLTPHHTHQTSRLLTTKYSGTSYLSGSMPISSKATVIAGHENMGETSTLEGPGPGDERVLHRFSEPNLDKVAIDSQLCRCQDGKGVVLKAGPAEDPSLQVRGPPYDVEGLSDERPDGAAAPVTVAEGAVDGPAGRTGGADRGRMGRMGQGVEG